MAKINIDKGNYQHILNEHFRTSGKERLENSAGINKVGTFIGTEDILTTFLDAVLEVQGENERLEKFGRQDFNRRFRIVTEMPKDLSGVMYERGKDETVQCEYVLFEFRKTPSRGIYLSTAYPYPCSEPKK